ncbi:MAG: hypothetical protein J6T59_01185 [Bacteroidales bacterium]|nr:hypothetical protein [Bacteroidales bacterium]
MGKLFKIYSIFIIAYSLYFSCWAQADIVDSFYEDDMMREIMDCSVNVINDSVLFYEKMPYFKLFYDLLEESERYNLLQKAQHLWFDQELHSQLPSDTKKDKLNFFIKIATYFQYFYANEQEENYREWVNKNIGDSLHFQFFFNGEKILPNNYSLFLVVQDSTGSQKIYRAKQNTESIFLPDTMKYAQGEVVVEYKNKYLPACSGSLSYFSSTSLIIHFYDKNHLDTKEYIDYLNKMDLTRSVAIMIAERRPCWGTGTISVRQITNLKELSANYKKTIKHNVVEEP